MNKKIVLILLIFVSCLLLTACILFYKAITKVTPKEKEEVLLPPPLPPQYKKAIRYYRIAKDHSDVNRKIPMYEEAIKYAQQALGKTTGENYAKIKSFIEQVRKEKWKTEEQERKREKEKITYGMTKSEVVFIYGSPSKKIKTDSSEKWYYKELAIGLGTNTVSRKLTVYFDTVGRVTHWRYD